tara:strand:- start:380 stop:583 length:204 start_codon:yes stop_codon:yes gene_type:complete
MSDNAGPKNIVELKQKIQEGLKNNNNIDETILNKIKIYKVATNLKELSKKFGNVVTPTQIESESGTP